MPDQRENILSRLAAVCSYVDGVVTAVRNRLDVRSLERPAIVILDGAEQWADAPTTLIHSELQRMDLTPAISIHIRGGNTVDGGALLSLYRSRLLSAVLNDAELISYTTPNGKIRYEGATVAPPTAEGNEYRIDLMLTFTYVFRLDDLPIATPPSDVTTWDSGGRWDSGLTWDAAA